MGVDEAMGGLRANHKSTVVGHLGVGGLDANRNNLSGGAAAGYAEWTAGAYTVALWKLNMASGNAIDSVNSIQLDVFGTGGPLTYEVAGSGDYAAWKGVTCGPGQKGFRKTTASTELDLAANEHAVIQAVFKTKTVGTYYVPVADNATHHYLYYFAEFDADVTKGYWRIADDLGNATGSVFTRPGAASIQANTFYKTRWVIERGVNATYYESGVQTYQFSIASIVGAITNEKFSIGADPGGNWPVDWTVFAIKIDTSTNAAVLSVNDDGPGGG